MLNTVPVILLPMLHVLLVCSTKGLLGGGIVISSGLRPQGAAAAAPTWEEDICPNFLFHYQPTKGAPLYHNSSPPGFQSRAKTFISVRTARQPSQAIQQPRWANFTNKGVPSLYKLLSGFCQKWASIVQLWNCGDQSIVIMRRLSKGGYTLSQVCLASL